MFNPLQKRGVSLILALTAFTATAQTNPRLIVLEFAPLDPEVSRAVSRQLTTALTRELAESFVLVSEAEVEGVRSGLEKPPDISAASALLAEAKQQLSNGQNKVAQKTLKSAQAILDPLRTQLRDYTPITSALLYSAVAAMNLNDKKGAATAFSDLARLRPDFAINPAEFPPNVLEAFQRARQAEVRLPRGRLVLTSTPPGARAYVDEVPLGAAPLTVPASPGEHVIRFEQKGHLSWTKNVTVESYAKVEIPATLEKNTAILGLKDLDTGPLEGAPPGAFSAPATVVAKALDASSVLVGIIALSVNGYLVSAAYLPADGPAVTQVVELDRSLKDEKSAMAQLAKSIAAASRAKPGSGKGVRLASVLGDAPLSRPVDFSKFALGVGPGGSAAVLADAARLREEAFNLSMAPAAPPESRTKWWLVAGGAGVVVAAAAGTAAYFFTRPQPQVQFELERQR